MSDPRPRLVLVGGGHTHALLLKRWAASPIPADVTVVADERYSTYSGMIPGVLAGDYDADEARIDLAPLAAAAGARFQQARVRVVDPSRNRIDLEDGSSLPWDIASLDVGSTLRGIDWPGVRKHTATLRPIANITAEIDRRLAANRAPRPRIAVVGGGAAGVEIAFTLQARLEAAGRGASVLLACGRSGPLPHYPDRARRLVAAEAKGRDLSIVPLPEVRFADSEGIGFEDGHLDADLVVWATGPAAPDLVRNSPLLHDRNGFARVQATLQVVGEENLFAVGDCATVEGWASLPKAGVHAVRQAPQLDANLRARVAGTALKPWHPKRQFLSLLNLGHHRALAVRWNLAVAGVLPWMLKDRIDRGFVDSFRSSLPPAAVPSPQAES